VAINIPILTSFSGKGVADAQREFKSLTSTTEKAGFILQRALLPAAAAIGTITQVIAPAIRAASDFEEATSKVNIIFGKASKSVKDFADTAATSLGQSKQSVLDAAGAFGTFGKAAGLAGEDLALFTTDFVTLATDLASFNNTSPEEAVQAIGAALRGESEPLRRFGVLLNDATLKAEAMELGIYSGSGALTAQQKILAAQSAIYKQTGDAQGDFARTADGLANSQRTLSALFANFQIQLGQKLLPATTEFANGLIDIANAMKKIPQPTEQATDKINFFTKILQSATNPIAGFINGLRLIGSGYFDAEKQTGAYNQAVGTSTQQQIRAAEAATEFNKKFKDTETKVGGAKKEVESFATALKEKLGEAVDTAKDKLAEAQGEFNDFATKVSDAVKGALDFNAALEAGDYGFKGFLQALRDQVKGVVEYSTNLGKALEMGLSQDALGYVLDAGNVAGAEIALELVKGGQTAIDETNALVEAAQRAADKVGIEAANNWYKTGVDQAQFIVNGLEAELTKLTPKLMAKMDQIAASLKRSVNIDVIVTERVNRIVSTISSGIPKMANGGIVTGPTLALIGEAGPEAVVPLSQMGNMGNGGGVTINVTGGLATSAEIGQSVVNALRAYSRTAGPLQLQVA
jgi:predicted  nucleic acid-binding Zn-ribbon protein